MVVTTKVHQEADMFSKKLLGKARVVAREMIKQNQQESEFVFGRQGKLRVLRSLGDAHGLTSFEEQGIMFFIAFPMTS